VRDVITSSRPARRTVSPAVRNKALAAGAGQWLRNLPDLVADLEREWRSRHRRDNVSAASRIWRPAPGCGLPTGADHGRRLAGSIPAAWEELGRPCSERAIADALSCLARRVDAHDDERAVLVHGDVHQWNALQATGGGFKLVDPDGLVAEAECDLGVLMREDPVELLHGDPHERARWLAARCGLDASAIWEWGVAERVATGLVLTRIELQPAGRQMLATADHIACD
jgi:streptomycin 6-kinase